MNPCPFCGESIALEARLCRHCNRPTLYQIHIESLTERDAHELFKKWSAVEKKDFHWALIPNYGVAKEKWTQGRSLLAWNLTKKLALDLGEKFKPIPHSISQQTNAPLSSPIELPESGRTHSSSWLYLAATCLVLSGAWIYRNDLIEKSKRLLSQQNTTASIISDSQIPEISIPLPSSITPPKESSSESRWSAEAMNRLLNATVFIGGENSLGSGFIISSDGMILTNNHVTAEMQSPEIILHDGRKMAAQKVGSDSTLDIAVLKIPGGPYSTLEMGDANELFPGQNIITIGNPGGLSFTVTRGIVSYVGRTIKGIPFIQTDAAINRGNSGGPMITEDLKVVGINTLTSLKEQGISFALPINLACQPGALIASVKSCKPFEVTEGESPVALLQQNDASSEIVKYYQSLFANLKTNWKQKDDQLKVEIAERSKSNGDSDSQVLALRKERYERQSRYLREAISLFERQRGEKIFESLTANIDQQIDYLRAKDREINQQINSLN